MRGDFGERQGERFRPTLHGCIARDSRMARALESCYLNALYEVSAQSYRSLMCEVTDPELSALFEELAVEALYRFRLLGEMILALGGNPTVRAQLRVDACDWYEESCEGALRETDRMLRDAIREKKRGIDHMEGLLGKTQDRVLRSVLTNLISEEQRHAERLQVALG